MADTIRPAVLILAAPVLFVFSMAAFPWLWTRTDPRDCDLAFSLRAPDAGHVFGTDSLGCDYYAMTVHGARPAILVGISTTILVMLIGGAAGLAAGLRGGWVDGVISRITEIFAALPTLLGVLVLLTLLRTHSAGAVIAALALLGWPSVCRVARAAAVTARQADYVRAARALGASTLRIALRHVLPDTVAPIMVVGSTSLGGYIAAEGTLSYLGVGLRPPDISWGVMINEARHLSSGHPHLLLFPGGFLVVTVVCLILVGDMWTDRRVLIPTRRPRGRPDRGTGRT